MKRIATAWFASVLALVLTAAPRPVHAQGLAIGVEGGANFADLHVSGAATQLGHRTGYRVAGILRFGFAGPFGLETGIGLAQKGAVATPAQTGLTSNVDFNLNYVEVPLLLTLGIPTGPFPLHPRVFAGPQVGFRSTCSLSGTISGVSASVDCGGGSLGTASLDTNSTDFGLVFGGGLDFPMAGPLALTVDGRYDLGLSDINPSGSTSTTSTKNRSFTIMGGVLLHLP
jgi:hypothetical protein